MNDEFNGNGLESNKMGYLFFFDNRAKLSNAFY